MCGICGVINFGTKGPPDVFKVMRMRDSLKHRGPDDKGLYFYKNPTANITFGFGHTRLSIIDLTSFGHQPMMNEDNSICIVYNGEIYNYLDLRKELEYSYGHKFVGDSDTEVLLHAYEQWGINSLQKLNGIFAFALWDNMKNKFIVSVDRLGVKPLYYTKQGDSFIFASQLSAIREYLHKMPALNRQAVGMYFKYLVIHAPQTIYEGIYKLLPAHYISIDASGDYKIDRYWDLEKIISNTDKIDSQEEAVDFIKEEIKNAIEKELVSDVPIGLFLSGGIDSSLIAAIIKKELKRELKTFSVGFNQGHSIYNEAVKAKKISDYLGTEHYYENMSYDVTKILPEIIKHFGEPFGNPTAIPMYQISKFASEYVKVCLAGVGGDELFAGYPRYLGILFHSKFRILNKIISSELFKTFVSLQRVAPTPYSFKNRLRKYIGSISANNISAYEKMRSLPSSKTACFLNTNVYCRAIEDIMNVSNIPDILENTLYTDIKSYLADDLLTYCDRMSMANSLEVRVPLCNYKLVEASFRIASSVKIRHWRLKNILKKVLSQYMPDEILDKRKQGFSVPVGYWLKNELKRFGGERILSADTNIFKKAEVEKIWKEHQNSKSDNGSLLWAILVFNVWQNGGV